MKKLLALLLTTHILSADKLSHTLSNQGYTGLINTPNAMVMKEGDLSFHINNQDDYSITGYNYKKEKESQEDYIFGVGLFPYMEMQGRLSEAPGYHRDLSANFKVQLPYTHKYLPNFAIGAQDIGSAANQYGNYYAVLDKEFWFVRASLGYGHATVENEKKKRMNGLFGGLEVKTFDWLYLLAEDDSKEQFAGVRIHMPKKWTSWFELNTLIATNITNDYETSLNVNLTFPLYENIKSYEMHSINKHTQEVEKLRLKKEEKETTLIPTVSIEAHENSQAVKVNLPLKSIKEKLVALGIENITIAKKDDTIYLAYENNTFLFNDVDSIGAILGLLTQTEYKKFILEQKKSKTTVLTLRGDLQKAEEFYSNPNIMTKNSFTNSLFKVSKMNISGYEVEYENINNTSLKPRVEFSPEVKTFVGNEFGLFNYMLALRTKLQINLYEGIDITAVGDIHVHDSEIDDHRYDDFMKLYAEESHIESVMMHLSNNFFDGVNTASIGTFEENFYGVVDQYIYNIGNHTVKLKAGYFKQFQDGDPFIKRNLGSIGTRYLYMAKYSYLLEDYDTLFEINGGQYWDQDIGYELQVKRFFGDIAVFLQYEESKPFFSKSRFSEETNRYAGIGIEVPLTLRHTPTYKYGQIRGTNAFSYRIRSTIARKDGTNAIVKGQNYDPQIAIDSENYFYNRNRLQLSYLKTHAFRFVESYEKYAK